MITTALNGILNEIFDLTMMIQKKFPELYVRLLNTPSPLPLNDDQSDSIDFEDYLAQLKQQVIIYEKKQQTVNNVIYIS